MEAKKKLQIRISFIALSTIFYVLNQHFSQDSYLFVHDFLQPTTFFFLLALLSSLRNIQIEPEVSSQAHGNDWAVGWAASLLKGAAGQASQEFLSGRSMMSVFRPISRWCQQLPECFGHGAARWEGTLQFPPLPFSSLSPFYLLEKEITKGATEVIAMALSLLSPLPKERDLQPTNFVRRFFSFSKTQRGGEEK